MMDLLKSTWDFIQNEVLGMRWLNGLISGVLNACGLDTGGKIGGSVQFFIFGWKVAIVYVFLGLVIAVAGGGLIEKLHLEKYVEEYIRNGRARR